MAIFVELMRARSLSSRVSCRENFEPEADTVDVESIFVRTVDEEFSILKN